VGNDGVNKLDYLGRSWWWPFEKKADKPKDKTCNCKADLGEIKDLDYKLSTSMGFDLEKHEFKTVKEHIGAFLIDVAKEAGEAKLDKLTKAMGGAVAEISEYVGTIKKGGQGVAQLDKLIPLLTVTGVNLEVSYKYCTKNEKSQYVWDDGVADATPWKGANELLTKAGIDDALDVYKNMAVESGELMAKQLNEARGK